MNTKREKQSSELNGWYYICNNQITKQSQMSKEQPRAPNGKLIHIYVKERKRGKQHNATKTIQTIERKTKKKNTDTIQLNNKEICDMDTSNNEENISWRQSVQNQTNKQQCSKTPHRPKTRMHESDS